MFGSSVDKDGKEIPTGTGRIPITTGERVPGCEVVSFDFLKDRETEEVSTNCGEIKIRQASGAILSKRFYDTTEQWAIDETSRQLLHLFSKFMTKDEYYTLLGSKDGISFQVFIERLRDRVMPLVVGRKITMKVVVNKKGYPDFPKYDNFAELDGTTPSTLKTNPKYDIYEMPQASNMNAGGEKAPEAKDDLPF